MSNKYKPSSDEEGINNKYSMNKEYRKRVIYEL